MQDISLSDNQVCICRKFKAAALVRYPFRDLIGLCIRVGMICVLRQFLALIYGKLNSGEALSFLIFLLDDDIKRSVFHDQVVICYFDFSFDTGCDDIAVLCFCGTFIIHGHGLSVIPVSSVFVFDDTDGQAVLIIENRIAMFIHVMGICHAAVRRYGKLDIRALCVTARCHILMIEVGLSGCQGGCHGMGGAIRGPGSDGLFRACGQDGNICSGYRGSAQILFREIKA